MLKFLSPFTALPRIVALAFCVLLASCSFQSRQLDFVSGLWQDRLSKTGAETNKEAFWWNFNYAGGNHRLFPLNLQDSTALTDGKRWIVVLKENRIQLVRDLVAGRDVNFSFSKHTNESELGDGNMLAHGAWVVEQQSGGLDEKWRYTHLVRISTSATGKRSYSTDKDMKCGVPVFDFKKSRRITSCLDEKGDLIVFNVVELDKAGFVSTIIQRFDESEQMELFRSSTPVNERELRQFLDG